MQVKKLLKLGIITMVALLVLTACSKNDASKEATSNSGGKDGTEQTVINIATGGMPKPFSFVNDNNEIDGYDIQVVKAIFDKLPQYKINIEKTEFTSIFAGLDSDRYQIGANNFASNEERKQKYIYSDPIFKNQFVIAVAEGRDDIHSFADLEGKTTEVSPGVNYTVALENYNKDVAKTPVKLNYSEADLAVELQNVDNGTTDFNLIDASTLELYKKEFGLKLKAVALSQEDTDRIGVPFSYLLLSKGKDSEQLLKNVNARIKELIEDGTISEISKKYLDGDFAPEPQN